VTEQSGQVCLSGRGRQQVVTADDLVDALGGVVHHHREVVGGYAVAAPYHEVVDDTGVIAVQQVGDGVGVHIGA
jgi:hypothetical protein